MSAADVVEVAISDREQDVLALVGEHLTNAEIAQRLSVSVRTVESHVSSLLRKLGVADRRALAALAVERSSAGSRAGRLVGAPAVTTTFVGRAREREDVLAALEQSRLVTLLGPGGVGKTRLAIAVAEEAAPTLSGGAVFVDLVPVRDAFLVPSIAAALGVPERPGEPLEETLFESLRGRRTLVVLDNCEHVLDAVVPFVDRLLAQCPDARVLATSRERLAVPAEQAVAIPPLSLVSDTTGGPFGSEASTLFAERARAVDNTFDADAAAIAELCERLDGMPLAIELAAARSASLGVDGLLAALDDRLQVLTGGRQTAERHRSMRSVIEWSHELLDDDERAVFRRLGVFAGGFDLAGAAAVAGGNTMRAPVVADIVGRLVDKSLVIRRRAATGDRWRLLETVRAYALERLADSGEEVEAHARHLAWCATTAEALEHAMSTGEPWTDAFDAFVDDLRIALAAAPEGPGDDDATYRLAIATAHLLYARRFLEDAQARYVDAARHAPEPSLAGRALHRAGQVGFARMRLDLSYGQWLEAADLFESAGDRAGATSALSWAVGHARRGPGEFPEPIGEDELAPLLERARALLPDDDPQVATEFAVAESWGTPEPSPIGDPVLSARAVAMARATNDLVMLSNALDALGAAAIFEGHLREAYSSTTERVEMLSRFDRHDPRTGGEIIDILHMGMEHAIAIGDLPEARRVGLLARTDSVGRTVSMLTTSRVLIPLALMGEFDEALLEADAMRDAWERAGSPAASWMAPAALAAAMVCGLRGEDDAWTKWREFAFTLSTRPTFAGFLPFSDGRVALHQGRIDDAVAALAEMDRINDFYDAYALAVRCEVAVVAGDPGAETLIEQWATVARENSWAAACLDRARGRLHGDRDALGHALAGFDEIGARFEWAITALLVGGEPADAGRAVLDEIGCPPPA
jgi:predicted ATPase/DNA-binding CsgD family transcriptional regulator